MNAEQHHTPPERKHAVTPSRELSCDEALSALADGEIKAAELDVLMADFEGSAERFSNWHAYQVIGAVLRGNADPAGERPASDFLAAVRVGLETRHIEPVASAPLVSTTDALEMRRGRVEAANDAVFRWKLVAGFASLAAVMAVSWSAVSGSGAGVNGATGAQLASGSPAVVTPFEVAASAAAPSAAAPLVVSTGQGLLIRDAQLEALLAEHRQHGGMSALQMPSGFIRNATFEAAGR